jgi:very-short-patch-repair endonuclease
MPYKQSNSSRKPKPSLRSQPCSRHATQDRLILQRILYYLCRQEIPGERCEWEYAQAIPGRKFRIDIAFPDHRVAVELDGWQYHGKHQKDFQSSVDRHNLLVVHRWVVLHFTAGDIHRRPDYVIDMIRSLIVDGANPPVSPATHHAAPSKRRRPNKRPATWKLAKQASDPVRRSTG